MPLVVPKMAVPVKLVNRPLVMSCARRVTANGVLTNHGDGIGFQGKKPPKVTVSTALELEYGTIEIGHQHRVIARLTDLNIGQDLSVVLVAPAVVRTAKTPLITQRWRAAGGPR